MNLKALITTLVLGSSTMASADSVKVSGSVHVSLGGRPAPAPNYRPAPAPVVVADPCETPAAPAYVPAPSHSAHHPVPSPPIWQAPYYRITNTVVSRNASVYRGSIAASTIKSTRWNARQTVHGYGFAAKPTQAWFDLTEATRIDSNRELFTIGTDKGLFNKLRLQALGGGSSKITQVLVEFADSRGKASQVIKVNQLLDRHNSTFTIDLNGEYRSIKRIVVYGATDQGSAYKIQAM